MSPPYMPLYISDYLSATSHLDAAQSGAYLHLIMHYWQKGCLPDDDRFLARIARMTDRQWASAKPTIKAFFDENWRHDRVESEMAHAQSKAEARAISGKQGGIAKSLKNKIRGVAKATVLPEQTPSKTHSESLPSSSGLDIDSSLRSESKRVRAQKAADGFERFWAVWPNKIGKPDAARSFLKVADEIDSIIVGVERYIAARPPDRPWLNPSTFLNQRRWEDVPATVEIARNYGQSRNGKGSLVDAGLDLIRRLDDAERRDAPQAGGWPRNPDVVLLPGVRGYRP